jgi:hypothetical protein
MSIHCHESVAYVTIHSIPICLRLNDNFSIFFAFQHYTYIDLTWKLLALRHQIGQQSQLMLKDFAVRIVTLALPQLPQLGSIVVLLSCSKIASVNGKSFITANAGQIGGDGVMTAPPMNLPIELRIMEITMPILIASLATFN